MLMPRQKVPDLNLSLAGGGQWRLSESAPENFTLLVFYRGLHCPICATQLKDLQSKLPDIAKRGVTAVAISADDAARAAQSKADWGLDRLPLAYGLSIPDARSWGLYVSAARSGSSEPALFHEPGLFLVRPDLTLYFGSTQTMPFARPHLADLVPALDFVVAKDYPARGEA